MGAENILPSEGIVVMIAGQQKTLRFTMKTLALISKEYGDATKILEVFTDLASAILTEKQIYMIADFVSSALLRHDPKATREWVLDNCDIADIDAITPSLIDAYLAAFTHVKKSVADSENPPTA